MVSHDSSVGWLVVCPLCGRGQAISVGWLTVCPPCGPSLIPNHGGGISRDFSLAGHMCYLVHSSGSTKERRDAPLEKRRQSHEDHEILMDQPGLRQNKKKKKRPYLSYPRKNKRLAQYVSIGGPI